MSVNEAGAAVWRRWRVRFVAAEREENPQQEIRRLARKSAALMDTLEASLVPDADGAEEVPGIGLETHDSQCNELGI